VNSKLLLRHWLVYDFSLHLKEFRQPEREPLKVLIVSLAYLYAICLLESLWSFELRISKSIMFQEAFMLKIYEEMFGS